jgi:methylmalonyl-CoA/ethylmalonyl-CoA epimerase
MAVLRIEHLGIAVNTTENSAKVFRDLLESEAYKSERVESEAVETLFFRVGESKVELLPLLMTESAVGNQT